MPKRATVAKAKKDLRQGKSPGTAASEFVREEIHHVRRGRHGARSPEQIIAIGLSKARRAGVPLEPPAAGRTSKRTRRSALRDYARGQKLSKSRSSASSGRRRSAARDALERESSGSASKRALSAHARRVSRATTRSTRKRAAPKTARSKARRSTASKRTSKRTTSRRTR